MYVYAQTAMHKRRMLESPSCAVRVMQQPRLGDISPSALLSTVTPTATGSIDFNSPMLLGGIALLGLGLLFFYGKKSARQYQGYQRKRAKRQARISALESELALARAS